MKLCYLFAFVSAAFPYREVFVGSIDGRGRVYFASKDDRGIGFALGVWAC